MRTGVKRGNKQLVSSAGNTQSGVLRAGNHATAAKRGKMRLRHVTVGFGFAMVG